ncbi:hypothetical protein JXA31_07675 [Candidatus Bathyarchaeota archaeon]|nr:hypothetical protein [Candidatus Bathyarchaeota archaeon]
MWGLKEKRNFNTESANNSIMSSPVDFLNFLYDPIYVKYAVDLVIAVITAIMNMMVGGNNLRGTDYLFRAANIKTGAINWGVLTAYFILLIPNYAGNTRKLGWFIIVVLITFLISTGCFISAARGSSWKKSGTSAGIALASSSLVITLLSILILLFFDSNFFH